MPAIQLEQFQPQNLVTSSEPAPDSAEVEAIRREAYEQGIKEGAAAATEAFSHEQSQCLSRIEELIEDAFLTREEAHRAALSSFGPLLTSLVESIAPELSRSGLAGEISAKVEQSVMALPEETVTVFVDETQLNGVSQMLTYKGEQVTVQCDNTLNTGQARIEWGGGFDLIDLDSTTENIRIAINEFFQELQPKTDKVQHGN